MHSQKRILIGDKPVVIEFLGSNIFLWIFFKLFISILIKIDTNNLGLALGKNMKFYASVATGLKLKVRNFGGLIPTFVEVTGEKPVGWGLFAIPLHPE